MRKEKCALEVVELTCGPGPSKVKACFTTSIARLTLGSVPGIVLNIDLMILCFIDSFTAVLTFPTLKLDLRFGSVTVSGDPHRTAVYFTTSTLLIGTGTFQVDKRKIVAIRENCIFITAFEDHPNWRSIKLFSSITD